MVNIIFNIYGHCRYEVSMFVMSCGDPQNAQKTQKAQKALRALRALRTYLEVIIDIRLEACGKFNIYGHCIQI